MDSVDDEMGNVGNDNLGFGEARFEGILPLVGFKDSDDVGNEVVDAGRQRGGAFRVLTRFDSRKSCLRHLRGNKSFNSRTRKQESSIMNLP